MPRFTGFSDHSLDDKGRFVVPARYRERLGAGFVLTIAPPDRCLALYPPSTWETFCERLDAAPRKDERYRRHVRNIFAMSSEVTCDAQGRLLIPPALREYARIDREARAIGTLTRVEIWSPAVLGEMAVDDAEAADFATELGLY